MAHSTGRVKKKEILRQRNYSIVDIAVILHYNQILETRYNAIRYTLIFIRALY